MRFLLFLTVLGLLWSPPLEGKDIKGSSEGNYQLVDETVAIVNGEPILASDIKLYMVLFGVNDPKEALKKLEEIYLVAQYAQQKGLTVTPKQASEMVLNFAKRQGISLEQLYRELSNLGLGSSVFQNFLIKYNLYVAAIELFVVKPLMEDKERLELLIATKMPQEQPYYTVEILKIPKNLAEKNADLLVSSDIQTVAHKLGLTPIKVTVNPNNLKPQLAQVIKRLQPGQSDFAEDKDYLYMVKVDKIELRVPPDARRMALEKIKREKIREFIEKLKREAVIKQLAPLEG